MKTAFKYRTPWRLITSDLIKIPCNNSSFCINELNYISVPGLQNSVCL